MNPEELLYTKTHEWLKVENNDKDEKIATVGISDFALKELTDLVFMELPEVGVEVKAGEPFGEVESVKAVSDLNSPLDGKITAVNQSIPDDLEKLGADPYGEGWLVKIKISGESGLSKLMDYAAYQKQIAEEH